MTHPGPAAGKISPALLAILAVLLLLLGSGAGFLLRGVAPASGEGPAGQAAADSSADTPEEPPEMHVVDLGEFLVNVRSAQGLRYLRAQIAVEVSYRPGAEPPPHKGGHGKAEAFALSEAELLRAKDAVVRELSSSEFAALKTEIGRSELKIRLGLALGKALEQFSVGEILLVSFVMQ